MLRAALLACAFLALPVSMASAQFGFHLNRSGFEVRGEDMQYLWESVRNVLASGVAGTRDEWSNPNTNMSGESILLETYESDGTPCARVQVQARQFSRETAFDLRLCQSSDGTWGITG